MALNIVNAPQSRRVPRRPSHNWHLRHRPWHIQPCMIAPVLPGETLKNLLLQTRVVTDPLQNSLIGWWIEYYFFYVKHRDLYERDLLVSMHLDPNADLSSLDHADQVNMYHNKGTATAINWTDMCLRRITDEYFRAEGETHATAEVDSLPVAMADVRNYLDSATNADDISENSADFDDDLTSITAGQGDGTAGVFVSEIDAAMRQYELARLHNLTDMTFEDYLGTFGVNMPKEELHKPELIRYVRDWTYPTNTIDPSDGSASAACSWAVTERADKDRFFREPGFIFGVTVARPKVYLEGISTSAVQLMNDAFSWLPSVLSKDPWSSMKRVDAGEPPLAANTDNYWIDLKDLLLYGDQFINFALTATDANIIDLPTAALQKRYVDSDDMNSVFVDNTGASGKNLIRQDGVASLNILGAQVDTSPMSIGVNKTV